MEFGYKNLDVWHKAMDFAIDIYTVIEKIQKQRKPYRLFEQLETSATSVASNIAEGKGRYSKKEFLHFLYIARGSLYEAMTQLELLKRMGLIFKDDFVTLEKAGIEVASMLKGLINSLHK